MKSKNVVVFMALIHAFSAAESRAANGKNFEKVITVVFENTDYKKAIGQPFFKQLAEEGAHFTNFQAETHPSQGNYIALTSGSLNGVSGNGNIDLNVINVVDLLEAKGLTWKVYAEDFPGACFTGATHRDYARKHNPFISYLNIQKDKKRCANIVGSDEFFQDAERGTLPNYSFFIPNGKSDGHDTGVAFADAWYRSKFSKYLADANFMRETLVVTTFDESGGGEAIRSTPVFMGP